jgi:3-methyl-2-oxobutanoate hydroxymethyltransferase
VSDAPTVKDLLDAKGKRKLVLTTAYDYWTARAAEEAGVDMVITSAKTFEQLKGTIGEVRRGAPDTLLGAGLPLIESYASDAEALRLAGELCRGLGVDVLYASGLVVERFAALGRQRFPCVGHVGYLPSRNTWLGGPRAVGKTSAEALGVYRDVLALAEAGVIGVEMELVPDQVAAEITRRVKILTFSMGSGPDCDGQIVFSTDVLGTNTGHYPRHSRTYANLFEQARDALSRYRRDVVDGAFPADGQTVEMEDGEFERFMLAIEGRTASPVA